MANRVICAKKVNALVITCVRGAAWVTWKGSGDHVLEPGQNMEVRNVRGFCMEILRQGEALIAEHAPDNAPARAPDRAALPTAGAPPARSSSAA